MKKLLAILTACCIGLSLLAGCASKTDTPPQEQEPKASGENAPVVLRIAHQSNEGEPIAEGFLKFQEEIEAADVNITVDIYPAKQLVGSDADAIEACQLGEIDMTSVAEMQFAPYCQAFYIFNANYLFDGLEDARACMNGELGETLRQATTDADLGVEIATFFGGSPRGVFTSKKPVRVPADMEGIKMRTADNPINIAELEAMGASAIIMAGGECYTGFQQGAIEGWVSAMTSHVDQGYMDVCSNACDTMHTIYIPTILISTKTLESFSADQRAAYDAAIAAASEFEWQMVADQMDGLYEKLDQMEKEGTAVFSKLTDEERAQWKEVMVGATEDMVIEKLGTYSSILDMMRDR